MSSRMEHAEPQQFEQRFSERDLSIEPGEEPPLAAHLITPRALYTHHGIYAGNGRVIHYAGLAYGWRRGKVEDVSLERFAHGRAIRVRPDPRRFDRGEVVARARSRLGESRYRLLTNNCEHFCAWSLRAEFSSCQVERLLRVPRSIVRLRHLIAHAIRAWLDHSRHSVTEDSPCHPG